MALFPYDHNPYPIQKPTNSFYRQGCCCPCDCVNGDLQTRIFNYGMTFNVPPPGSGDCAPDPRIGGAYYGFPTSCTYQLVGAGFVDGLHQYSCFNGVTPITYSLASQCGGAGFNRLWITPAQTKDFLYAQMRFLGRGIGVNHDGYEDPYGSFDGIEIRILRYNTARDAEHRNENVFAPCTDQTELLAIYKSNGTPVPAEIQAGRWFHSTLPPGPFDPTASYTCNLTSVTHPGDQFPVSVIAQPVAPQTCNCVFPCSTPQTLFINGGVFVNNVLTWDQSNYVYFGQGLVTLGIFAGRPLTIFTDFELWCNGLASLDPTYHQYAFTASFAQPQYSGNLAVIKPIYTYGTLDCVGDNPLVLQGLFEGNDVTNPFCGMGHGPKTVTPFTISQ